MEDDDEEFIVTNTDTNETLTIGEASKKFSVMAVTQFPSKFEEKRAIREDEEEEDEYYFDAKQVSLSLGPADGNVYSPPSIPDGGRLQFVRISAGLNVMSWFLNPIEDFVQWEILMMGTTNRTAYII